MDLGGNKIVWASDAGAASDIYAYDLTTQTTTQLTSSAASDVFPVTDGRLVVWWTSSGTAAPHVYDLATGYTTQLGTSGVWGGVPHLDLGRIAWTAGLDTAAQVYSAVFPVFDDVPTTNLDFSAIQGLAERRIVSGYAVSRGATEFRGANPVLRAQFAKMVAGALRLPVNENMALPPLPTWASTTLRPMSTRRPYCTPDGQVVSQLRQVRQRSKCSRVTRVTGCPSSICLIR